MRSLSFGGRGILSLENDQRTQEENLRREDDELDVDDAAESLETELVDTAENEEREVEETERAIDDAVEDVEALESLADSIALAAANGGMNQFHADTAQRAAHAIYKRLGYSQEEIAQSTMSLESFGGLSDQKRSTVALEADMREKAKQVWETIKKMILRAIDFVVNLWQRFMINGEKLGERAKKIVEAAGKIGSDQTQKATEIENPRIFGELVLGGKVPTDASGAKRILEVTEDIYKNYPASVEALTKAADAAADGKNDAASEALKGAVLHLGLDNVEAKVYGGADDATASRSKELPGEKALVCIVGKDKAAAGIHAFDPKKTPTKGEKVGLMNAQVAKAAAEAIGEVAALVVKGKDLVKKAVDAKKKLLKAADKAAKKAEGDEKKDLAEAAKDLRAALVLIDQPWLAINKYAILAGKAVLDQAELSLKAYGKEEKK